MGTVIVATDGSDLATHAALAGLALTKPADRLLVVCAVDLVEPFEDATGHAGPTITPEEAEASNRQARTEGQAAVDATTKAMQEAGDVPEDIERLVIDGGAGPALCRLAVDVDASVVILGSRGRGGLRRALLGSVSDYVVRNAPCSVVVSKGSEP